MKRIVTILILSAVVLLAAAPTISQKQDEPPLTRTEEFVVYSQKPYDFRILRDETLQTVSFRMAGLILECDSIYDVRVALIGNPSDSTSAQAVPIARTFYNADGCIVEMYMFGMHVGLARKILEAEGEAEFVVICANGVLRFQLTSEGEKDLLEFLNVEKAGI